jgi:hypothetical protein
VKVKQCHFCAYIGCGDCINKKFPFPANNKDYANRGKICKVCENKFYIKIVSIIFILYNTSIDLIKDIHRDWLYRRENCN